jgi:NADPH-dependent curcumin reductase CurA
VPTIAEGQLLVRTRMISIDAANRAWMQGMTYRSALAVGTLMAGLAISEVVESRAPGFAVGDLVFADSGWQDYAALDAGVAKRQPPGMEPSHLLSLYGTSALTAYFGLTELGALGPGDTLVVSAAGGSVGTAAGQIGHVLGARVIGIAGGADKCRWLVDDLGFDAAIDYKAGDLRSTLKRIVPEGIDVYFDNVGGDILDTCLFAMNTGGRIICCGAVSSYDAAKPLHGPRGVPGMLITKRLTMRGFIVDDFADSRDRAFEKLREWHATGAIRAIEDIVDGLENAPAALIDQLAGGNRGKRMVRLA